MPDRRPPPVRPPTISRAHVVIAYDVTDDRQRDRLARVLLGHGQRVQKSVFEVPQLPFSAFLRLRSLAEELIDPATDSLRYYRLCLRCSRRVDHHGAGAGLLAIPEPFEIIG
jgi:CRISPR-associated protein Cas2